MAKAKGKNITMEDALVPVAEQPYEVPENWCWTKLGALINLHRGVSYKKNDAHDVKEDGDCLILRGGNIGEGYIDVEVDNVYVSKELVEDYQLVRENDIVIVGSTGSTKVIGRAGISLQDYSDVAFGAFLMLARPIGEVNAKYIGHLFQSDIYRNRIRTLASGVNINNIKADYINETAVPLPPLPEQQRIVEQIESMFSKLDDAKSMISQGLEDSENRKSAILLKSYSGEYTKGWREKNNIRRDKWERVKLSDVCKVNPSKIDTRQLADDLEVSFFPMNSLSEITGTIVDPQIRKLSEVKQGFTNFIEGDVVFAKITPCMENGKSAIIGRLVNDIGYGTTEFYVLRCSKKLINKYLYYLIRSKSFRDEAKAVMTGAVGQQRVPKSFIENYVIELPTVEEQLEIIRIVEHAISVEQTLVDKSKLVIDNIDFIKKSILAKAFRGELGTNDPLEESSIELLKQIIDSR